LFWKEHIRTQFKRKKKIQYQCRSQVNVRVRFRLGKEIFQKLRENFSWQKKVNCIYFQLDVEKKNWAGKPRCTTFYTRPTNWLIDLTALNRFESRLNCKKKCFTVSRLTRAAAVDLNFLWVFVAFVVGLNFLVVVVN